MFLPKERDRRWGIAGIGVAWLVVGAGNLAYGGTNQEISGTNFLGVMFLISGCSVLAFLEKPASFVRFFVAGIMSVTTLFLRASAILYAQWLQQDPNLLKIAMVQAALHGVLFFLFWWFWQNEVKLWHTYHLQKKSIQNGESPPDGSERG